MGRVADPSRMSGFSAPHCGSLRASDEGRELELYGWVARRRDHGGLIFIDLRDRWGTVQVVFNPAHAPQAHTTASDLRSEFVVRVEGKVARRRPGAENPRMPTGEVEVAASDLEVIAVAQSPQQLKQLLMVAGIGRYYQIARCLRDEDLRADRVVEITQLDVEMSFCTEEDVFALIEGLWATVWKDVLGIEIPTPFQRIDMQESLLRYGTDKPDLRYELEIADVSDALRGSGATVFRSALDAGGVVRCLAVPGGKDMSRRELDEPALLG